VISKSQAHAVCLFLHYQGKMTVFVGGEEEVFQEHKGGNCCLLLCVFDFWLCF
jgi:hypothetical protein